jgi:hypothetical protein
MDDIYDGCGLIDFIDFKENTKNLVVIIQKEEENISLLKGVIFPVNLAMLDR